MRYLWALIRAAIFALVFWGVGSLVGWASWEHGHEFHIVALLFVVYFLGGINAWGDGA